MSKHILTERAMLVSLSVSYWTGKASDERVIDEVTAKHKTERDVHDYRKVLIQPKAINEVKAVRSRARAYHFERTLPWIDGGTRILPANFYFEYTEKMREFRNEYETEVAKFIGKYSQLKGEARKRLGSLFRDEDYPKTDELRSKFAWDQAVLPIPDRDDWRVTLGAEADAEIKKQIDQQVNAAMHLATRDLWSRLHKTVAALAEKMKESDPIFRDSIIGNIRELVEDVLPAMNVTADPKLESMRKTVAKELAKLKPEELREDEKARKKTADAADKILKAMAGYVTPS